MRRVSLPLFLTIIFAGTTLAQSTDFPRPESLKPAIEFWTRVYTEVDTSSGFMHDNLRLDVVYETIRLPESAGPRQRRRTTDAAREKYQAILTRLGRGVRTNLNDEERRVLALWPEDVTNAELTAAARRVRFQLGQSNRFRAGLARSGAYKPHIEAVLREHNLPLELAALPHVESSFNPAAYSHVGAAGLWQFTRSTGLRYMQIDHIVDERRDPFISTRAAARLLEDDYAVVESWPLAITAYNHGVAGMRRASTRLGTKDIGRIVAEYDGRTFGFASRNFYVAFLAALDIDKNPERYFGSVRLDTPESHALVEIPDYVGIDTLTAALDIRRSELERLNPALMETVWQGDKFVPKGFELRVPASRADAVRAALTQIPAGERYAAQQPDLQHRVRRGDTLSGIADRYRVSVATLVRMNGLRSSHFIREGQTLALPGGTTPPPTLAAASASATIDLPGTYVVRRGDSIDRISRRLGVDAQALLAANDLSKSSLIFPGQSLTVPDPTSMAVALLGDAPIPTADMAQASNSPTRPPENPAGSLEAIVLDGLAARVLPAPVPDEEPTIDDLASDNAFSEDVTADGTAAPAPIQVELAADPSDYSVADDGTIEVHAVETLGHYADWLGIRTQRLRDINGLPFGQPVVIGQRIKLDFSVIDRLSFEQRRVQFQRENQEAFFSSYQIADVSDHVIRPGESLWVLAQRRYNVPVWLLRQYNPDLDFDRVSPGTVVKFPSLTQAAADGT